MITVKANTARRFRLYPSEEQARRLMSWADTCRAVWNIALAQRVWAYRSARRVTLCANDQCAELTEARREYDWLRDLPAQCAQQVLRQLDDAYRNFWSSHHRAGYPRFKRKRDRHGLTFPGQAVAVRTVSRRTAQVKVPKLGWIRFRLSRSMGGTIRHATISRDGLGWHVSFGVHIPDPVEKPVNVGAPVGVDVGIACSVFVSDEHRSRQRPDSLTEGEQKRLLGLQQRKSRQLAFAKKHNDGRYSKRLRRTIAQIATLSARQARRRANWNHMLTTDLAKSHSLVVIEDLKVRNMVRSGRGTVERPGTNVSQKAGLNRSISNQGWFEIRRQLVYKTRRHGSELVAVAAAGTSQTCNRCGTRDPASRDGCGRLFACTACGHTDHADRNAALVILDRGLTTAGRKPAIERGAGFAGRGPGKPQSTRSPHGQGTHPGSRLREPSSPDAAP